MGNSRHAVRKAEPLRSHRQGLPSLSQPKAAVQDEQPQTTPTPAPSDPGTGQAFPTESPDIMDRNRWSHVPTDRACQRDEVAVPTTGFWRGLFHAGRTGTCSLQEKRDISTNSRNPPPPPPHPELLNKCSRK